MCKIMYAKILVLFSLVTNKYPVVSQSSSERLKGLYCQRFSVVAKIIVFSQCASLIMTDFQISLLLKCFHVNWEIVF